MTSREAAREMTEIEPYRPTALLIPRSCVTEQVGSDVVTLDEERLHYHTMHEQVFQVLRASDGTRSVEEIAALVFGTPDETRTQLTGQALLDLMDAELIAEDSEAKARFLSRRSFGKAAAALLLGGVGLPLVKSISAPDAASAFSRCGTKDSGDSCSMFDEDGCKTCCCCIASTQGTCQTVAFCSQFAESGYSCK